MNRIKIVGILVFCLSVVLALLSNHISKENRANLSDLTTLNEQKAFTQEISKSIFYSYRNNQDISEMLDKTTAKFIANNSSRLSTDPQILERWNKFYADVTKFRKTEEVKTAYSTIVTEKLVNRIYHNNVMLVNELDKLIERKKHASTHNIETYKKVQYLLFFILILLLIYLFTQVRLIIEFIQKFTKTSKKIIENSTIQGLKPIVVEEVNRELKEATKNYNHLVEKIDSSITYTTQAMEQTNKSLEEVAKNIEDFMELLSSMHEDESDRLFEKEDAVIDSLETIMSLRKKLKYLQKDLEKLTSKKEL